jgi:hypothetical protein
VSGPAGRLYNFCRQNFLVCFRVVLLSTAATHPKRVMPKQPPNPSWALQAQPVSASEPAGGPAATADPAEAARYIAEFAAELSVLARHARLDLLAYLLDMARLEATKAQRAARTTDRA